MSDPALRARLRREVAAAIESAPDGIPRVLPPSPQAAADLCGFAHREGLRVRLEGRGTWMPADAPADFALSTGALTRIIAIAPADLVATVEVGLGVTRLNQALLERGVWLALDPPGSPDRSLGSVIATGTAGPLRHGFGPVRDHLLGLTVVTGDGRIVRAGGKVVKNVAGYDLTRLQVGGFGGFGLIAEAHLRLRARPEERLGLQALGPRDRLTRTARDLMEAGLSAAVCELFSPEAPGAPWRLAIELRGTREAVAAEALEIESRSEVSWTRTGDPETGRDRAGILEFPVTIRLGVFPDSLDEVLDLLEDRLGPGTVSAGPGRGLVRWSGSPDAARLREVRRLMAAREIPVTLERAPRALLEAVGHFGEYREGVAGLVSRLREIFDPSRTFPVAWEAGRP
jgi:FAD/FMN-containing dehydrogenase